MRNSCMGAGMRQPCCKPEMPRIPRAQFALANCGNRRGKSLLQAQDEPFYENAKHVSLLG